VTEFEALRLRNVSSYRPLSAFSTREVTDVLTHDTPSAVCLFTVANGALLMQKLVRTGTMFRVRCRSGVSAACFDVVTVADSDRQTDMPQHQLWDVV